MEKSDLNFSCIRVHDEFSVIGQEFVNSIATNIYLNVCKIIDKFQVKGTFSYKEFIKHLNTIWRRISDTERENAKANPSYIFNEGMPSSYDQSWVNAIQSDYNILESLNISKKITTEGTKSKENSNGSGKRSSEKNTSSEQINIKDLINSVNDLQDNLKKKHSNLFDDNIEQDHNESLNKEESDERKPGRPRGSLNKTTVEKKECANDLYNLLEEVRQKLAEAEEKAEELENLSKVRQTTSNNNDEPKARKERSDKGKTRGPYKKRSQGSEEQDETTALSTEESANNLLRQPKARKERSDKGITRGPYKLKFSQNRDF